MRRNQTLSYLQRRLAEIGIRPDARHGQNFLIDINLQKLIVAAADLSASDVVLEVGTGTGALTELIAEQAGAIVTVELDQNLYHLASEVLVDCPHVVMLRQDALKNKNRLAPEVIAAVQAALAAEPGRRLKLVANLPYSVATPVLSNLLSSEIVPVSMTVTIQKELADRIMAAPGTRDYSALSVWMQSQCEIELVRVLPPSVFWPRPKVTSAVIRLVVCEALRNRVADLNYFHQFIRALFLHRRKFIRGNMLAAFGRELSKAEVDEILAEMSFDAEIRAEQLDVETLIAFGERMRRRVPQWRL